MYSILFHKIFYIFLGIMVFSLFLLSNYAFALDKGKKGSYEEAVFAGGCFWCMEAVFEKVPGVLEAVSGYTGGNVEDPTYEEVSRGTTGHFEAVVVKYDPTKVSYERLLEVYWKHIDPTDPDGQFFDRGPQYQTAIFYKNREQKELAEISRERIDRAGIFSSKIVTMILPFKKFYPAEEYHQDYYKKQPIRYKAYVEGSKKERFFENIWKNHPRFRLFPERSAYWIGYKKPSPEALKKILTHDEYRITQENGTDSPFHNRYWNNHKKGIYVDIVSGEPLFSSIDKYDSGSGWPSFTKPLEEENIVTREDRSFGMIRVEVRSRHADSHLGHLFDDGPPPTYTRYCINSSALYFIPFGDLVREGYGAYKTLFK